MFCASDPDHTTWFLHDDLGRRTYVTDALGGYAGDEAHSVVTAYNAVGNVTSVTDQLGRTTSYQYDAMNWLVQKTLPDPDGLGPETPLTSPVTTWQYDAAGNVASTTDPMENTTWYRYDALHRRTRAIDALGAGPEDLDHATITTYDAVSTFWRNRQSTVTGHRHYHAAA